MKRFFKITLLSIIIVLFLSVLFVMAYVLIIASDATLDQTKLTKEAHVTHVYDMVGEPIDNGGDYAPLSEIPEDLINAFVAVEDKRFFHHNGLDYRRIVGAVIANLKSKSASQGASTITCQLVKNTHLTQEKTLTRKIKEAKLALDLEKRYSKEEILEMYLNIIYLGAGNYGVKAAANDYFGKTPMQLSLTECAALAATTVNPSLYSPAQNAQNNQKRRKMVLDLMQNQGFITEQQAEEAQSTDLVLRRNEIDIYKTYRINAIDEAARLTGISPAELATGYHVYTYCDECAQTKAYAAMHADARQNEVDYMVMYADVEGRVNAYCSTFDNAQSAIRRQIGSTVKPFVYASAIEQNLLLPDTVLVDEPQSFGDYSPHNYHDIYYGKVTARDALAHSANVAAVKTLGYAGLEKTFDYIQKAGLPLHDKDKHMGLALGGFTYGCTADELATAYCTLACGGTKHTAALVDKVLSPVGQLVYQRNQESTRVFSPATAYLVTDMLCATVRTGTAKRLGALGISIAAKTGTVEAEVDNSDAWCVAYTPSAVCVAWAGNLSMQKDKMTSITGGGDTASIVQAMFDGASSRAFARPDSITQCEIDDYTYQKDGTILLASPNVPTKYRKSIWTTDAFRLDTSRAFEQAPNVDCHFFVDRNGVNLSFAPSDLCSYQVYYDNGFQTELVEEIKPQSNEQNVCSTYDLLAGWWSIRPILHGKSDIAGQEYRVLIM